MTIRERRSGIFKKGALSEDPCVPWLRQLSKAALLDCVVDLLTQVNPEGVDAPVGVELAVERLTIILKARGDVVPR